VDMIDKSKYGKKSMHSGSAITNMKLKRQ